MIEGIRVFIGNREITEFAVGYSVYNITEGDLTLSGQIGKLYELLHLGHVYRMWFIGKLRFVSMDFDRAGYNMQWDGDFVNDETQGMICVFLCNGRKVHEVEIKNEYSQAVVKNVVVR